MVSLSIVIPAYNEELRLPATLDAVAEHIRLRNPPFVEVLIVNDGSQDQTAAVVEERKAAFPYIQLLNNPGNRGKGYSVRHGMLAARGEWILSTDADLSAPIGELDKLLKGAQENNASVAIGSRALDRTLIGVHQPAFREYSGRMFNSVMRLVTGMPFRDTQCGFKLFKAAAAREIFSRQQLDGFSFDVENLFVAQKLGIRTIEVPVRWNNVLGTKVDMLHGMTSFTDLLRIRWYEATGRYT